MPDLLQKGVQWLNTQRTKYMAREVTYCHATGGSGTVVRAGVGSKVFTVDSEGNGVFQEFESRVFTISADLLACPPTRGDLIKEPLRDSGDLLVYAVLAPNGTPVWEWTDSAHTAYRIFTKFVRRESP